MSVELFCKFLTLYFYIKVRGIIGKERIMAFDRVNQFLANIENNTVPENEVVINGAEAMKNIMISELKDIPKLDRLSNELLGYLSKDIKNQSRKDQQSFWRDVEAVKARKEDWIYKIMQDANKNGVIMKLMDMAMSPRETVISENGEVFQSSITEENKTHLKALLVDLLNDKARS